MKKLITIIALLLVSTLYAQNKIRTPEKEHAFISVSGDYAKTLNPNESKYGTDIVVEFGIKSAIGGLVGMEAKVGIESFPKLVGGYFDIHGAFGFRMVHGYEEQHEYYIGGRLAKVYRTNPISGKAYRINPGIEAKYVFYIVKNIGLGLKYTYDKRYEMEIMDWNVKSVHSTFIIIEIKLFEL
jgi:hypothetical protein